MKAVQKTEPKIGAKLVEVPTPTNLKPGWALVKVRATSICGTDIHIWNWDQWSQGRMGEKALPQVLGHEFCGEVVELGPNCNRIKVGDYVSAETHIYDPGDLTSMLGIFHVGNNMKILGVDTDGCFADYVAIPEIVLWKNDKTMPPEYASIQEPLGNACYAVMGEDNDVYGKTMLITGDGPISLFAIGVAKAAGASKIIQFGMAQYSMEIGRKMGVDIQIDVTKTTPDERYKMVMDNTGGWGCDIVCEMIGAQSSLDDAFRCIRKGGRFSAFGIPSKSPSQIDYTDQIVFKGIQIHGISGRKIFDTWYRNGNMLANRKLDPTPVVTHLMALEDYQKAFEMLTAPTRQCAKIVMFPDKQELNAAMARRK